MKRRQKKARGKAAKVRLREKKRAARREARRRERYLNAPVTPALIRHLASQIEASS